jgi:hypothetical protein
MFHSLYSQLGFVALFGVCGLAIGKGGPAERGGAVLILLTWIGAMVELAFTRQYVSAVPFLLSDAALAIGLLVLAIRYSSLWMGGAMLLQAIGLSFHAAYFGADKAEISAHLLRFYVLGKNLASGTMLLVILAGTLASWGKRLRSAAREAKAQTGNDILPAAPAAG